MARPHKSPAEIKASREAGKVKAALRYQRRLNMQKVGAAICRALIKNPTLSVPPAFDEAVSLANIEIARAKEELKKAANQRLLAKFD